MMTNVRKQPFLFCLFILCVQALVSMGFIEAKGSKRYDLVICAIFKDEDFFLKEWIEYHKLRGVEYFYLYNNGSTDRSLKILEPYIKAKEVRVIPWMRESSNQKEYNFNVQIPAYNHALAIVKKTARWAAFIDVDEFICPVNKTSLVELLKGYESYGGLAINWQIYGTSHRHSLQKRELLTEALVYKKASYHQNHHVVKCIVQPRLVSRISDPHSFFYHSGYCAVNSSGEPLRQGYLSHDSIALDVIRLNHYWYGTHDWFMANKIPRRAKWGLVFSDEELKRVIAEANDEFDDIMVQFAPALRKALFSSSK